MLCGVSRNCCAHVSLFACLLNVAQKQCYAFTLHDVVASSVQGLGNFTQPCACLRDNKAYVKQMALLDRKESKDGLLTNSR